MARLPDILGALSPEAQAVYDRITAKRGKIGGPYAPLMHHPALAEHLGNLGEYFPEFELDIDFAPRLCGRDPNLSLQITALKAQLNDTFELVFNATAGTQNPPRGWFANGAVELDIHPFRSGILKPLEIDTQVNGGGLIIPQPAPDHDFRTGTFGFQMVLKYQF